jgi:hypothetical protein
MNDYLHALAERAQGVARGVRPQPVGRFEPGLPLEYELEVPAPAPAPSLRAPATEPSKPARVRPAPPSSPALADAAVPPAEAAGPPVSGAGVERPPDEPRAAGASESDEAPAAEVDPVSADARAIEPAEPEPVEATIVRELAPAQPGGEPAVVEIAVEREVPAEACERAAPVAPVRAPARRARAASWWTVGDDVLPPEPAEGGDDQVVHVSIGRVEVRAPAAPARPPQAPVRRWAGPRLSLDDYLRDRGGRGR